MSDAPQTTGLADPPATPAERRLAGFWEELLEVENVGRADSFVALGGNSLLASMVANRVEKALGYRPTVAEIFSLPLAELARRCEAGATNFL